MKNNLNYFKNIVKENNILLSNDNIKFYFSSDPEYFANSISKIKQKQFSEDLNKDT